MSDNYTAKDATGTPIIFEATDIGGGVERVSHTIHDGADIAQGAMADAVAGTDTGTFSLIALTKRLLQKLTTGIGITGSVAVTGTFYQATQPVSNATLPLPTGASTEATLAAQSAKLPSTLGQKTMANSLAITLASDQGNVPVSIASGGGGPVTIADGGAVNIGAAANTSSSTTVMGYLLKLISLLPTSLVQKTMAGSLPVVIASDQSAVPVSGTFFQATQPVSNATLPLPTGASTSAKQPAFGTAGAASADVVTIQGIASGTVVPISIPGTVPLPTGASTEVTLAAQSAKLPATLGQKTMANGLAVSIASDQSVIPVSNSSLPLPTGASTEATLAAQSAKLPATLGQKAMAASLAVVVASDQSALPVTGTFYQATQPVSIATAPVLVAGSAIIGKVGIDQTTPGTTNGVQINAAIPAGTNNIGLVSPTSGKTILRAVIDIAAATVGDNQIVAADATKKIKVVEAYIQVGAATVLKWRSGTTVLVGAQTLVANQGVFMNGVPLIDCHHFETAANQALNLNSTVAVVIGGYVNYYLE